VQPGDALTGTERGLRASGTAVVTARLQVRKAVDEQPMVWRVAPYLASTPAPPFVRSGGGGHVGETRSPPGPGSGEYLPCAI
jgi:hypothetical protein